MSSDVVSVLGVLLLSGAALAQSGPATLDRPLTPRVAVPGLTLKASATPREGGVTLNLDMNNAGSGPLQLGMTRDSLQGCAPAPHLRVLKVGTREVVYPDPAQVRLCAQDVVSQSLASGATTRFSRDVNLAPGDYLMEVWYQGFVNDGERVRIPASAVLVTVR